MYVTPTVKAFGGRVLVGTWVMRIEHAGRNYYPYKKRLQKACLQISALYHVWTQGDGYLQTRKPCQTSGYQHLVLNLRPSRKGIINRG